MVKVHTLVPLTHPTTGEQFAAGAEVDVADDVAADWKADGKIAFSADEEASAKAAAEGNYSARTGRDDTASTESEEAAPKKGKG
jgi:hypothetical protein